MNTKKLVSDFELFNLSGSEWNHQTHLIIALWYIYYENNFYTALQKIKCGLIRRGSIYPAELCYMKYHETITVFYAYQLKELILENENKSFEEIELLMLNCNRFGKHQILKYYPKTIFNSSRLRSKFVSPKSFRYFLFGYSKPTARLTLELLFVQLGLILIGSIPICLSWFIISSYPTDLPEIIFAY